MSSQPCCRRGARCAGLLAAPTSAHRCTSTGLCPLTSVFFSSAGGSSDAESGNKRSAIISLSLILSFILLGKKKKAGGGGSFPVFSSAYRYFLLRAKILFLYIYINFILKSLCTRTEKVKLVTRRPQIWTENPMSLDSRCMLFTSLSSVQTWLTLLGQFVCWKDNKKSLIFL